MNPVPSSPDPDRRPAAGAAAGKRRRDAAPALSIGSLDDVRPGSLLVAMPGLTDPTFAGAVVYVLDHTDTGTLGVVLGRPSEVRIGDVLPGWAELAVEPGVFHVGGPCETDTALCLATTGSAGPADPDRGLRQVADGVHLVDLDTDPEELDGAINGLRVFAGYAGWSPGQLESELERDDWILEPAQADDVFTEVPDDLWSDVLERKGGQYALVARMPEDPSLN